MHIVIPACIFLAAGFAAMRLKPVEVNQIASTGLVLLMIFYWSLQCGKGRTKRMEVRKDMLFTKFQLAQRHLLSLGSSQNQQRRRVAAVLMHNERPDDDDSVAHDAEEEYYLGQTRGDIQCAHPYCVLGCYREDRSRNQRSRTSDDLCSTMYELCCPDFCGRHVQIAGMCAIAQEGREMERTILPAPYRRIDYITMQSILQYYPAIYQHRHKNSNNNKMLADDSMGNITRFLGASSEGTGTGKQQPTLLGHPLSRLSHYLVQTLKLFLAIMLTWSVIGPLYWSNVIGRRGMMSAFQVQHFIVMILTFVQAFGYIVAARYLVRRTTKTDPELSMDAIIKYFASGFFLSASLAIFWEFVTSQVIDTFIALLLAALGVVSVDNPEMDMGVQNSSSNDILQSLHGYFGCGFSIGRPEYAVVFGYDHPVLYTIYIFLVTFFVAAFIEELCKYFGFRMVEHPDFLSSKDLHDASVVLRKSDNDDDEDEDEDVESPSSTTTTTSKRFSKQLQSVQAQGAAITLAMVTVAIGFSCCENLLYVFFYSAKSFLREMGILIERSLFPVHPILAAIQSIGVCARFLEHDKSYKLGGIIKASVLIHGMFDFLIVFINFIGNLIGQQYQDGDLKISNVTEFISLLLCVGVLAWSVWYLDRESTAQRQRLATIDESPRSSDRNLLM